MNSQTSSCRFSIDKLVQLLPGLAFLFLIVLASAPDARAANAFIRVNQMGYETGVPGRAYLMSKVAETGAVYRVLDSSGNVRSSTALGATTGTWGEFTVYALDFKVNEAGNYALEVRGPANAASLQFKVDTAQKLFKSGVANALYFYQNERDGAHFIQTPLRSAAGHLNDSRLNVYASPQFDADDLIIGALEPSGLPVDASGGWWDAGDYIKFVQTHSYTIALMLIGVRDFPKQMGASAGSSNFSSEAKFGVDWLNKMWNDGSQTLYYQVGIGTGFEDNENLFSDHDLWRLPQEDDAFGGTDPNLQYIRSRPVFVAGAAGAKISPNLAGRLAASFAGCYQVLHKTNPGYADKCLLAAEHIFDLADTAPAGDLLTVAPFDFYGEGEWRDDLELGATELYFAIASADCPLPPGLKHTNANFYLKAASHWAHEYINGPCDACDTLNLYDVSGLAHFELYRAIDYAGGNSALEVTPKQLLADMRKELKNAKTTGAADPFGYGFPWASYDSATHGAGLAVMAHEFAFLTGNNSYEKLANQWSGNILGANAWGSSFIAGDGDVFPNCMQHQVANIVGTLDGTEPVLRGALVEGPNSFAATGTLDGMRACPADGVNEFKKFNGNGAVYRDRVQSYSTVEPAIDLTAASFLMFSWPIAGAPAVFAPSVSADAVALAADDSADAAGKQWPPKRSPRSKK